MNHDHDHDANARQIDPHVLGSTVDSKTGESARVDDEAKDIGKIALWQSWWTTSVTPDTLVEL